MVTSIRALFRCLKINFEQVRTTPKAKFFVTLNCAYLQTRCALLTNKKQDPKFYHMPKHLYLLRHAQSADKQISEADKERELTPQGSRESLLIGSYLLKNKISLDAIFTSAANRAKRSAELIADAIKTDIDKIILHDELFQASPRTFLDVINQFDNSLNHVMCVGHNPTITYVAEYITKAEIGDIVPGGMAIIQFNFNSWSEVSGGNGELVNYIYPAMLIND
jgi:phosphohistidine phosphatase